MAKLTIHEYFATRIMQTELAIRSGWTYDYVLAKFISKEPNPVKFRAMMEELGKEAANTVFIDYDTVSWLADYDSLESST